jgi:hypothetical protein
MADQPQPPVDPRDAIHRLGLLSVVKVPVVAGVTANSLAALIYNLISRLAGGVALDSTGQS